MRFSRKDRGHGKIAVTKAPRLQEAVVSTTRAIGLCGPLHLNRRISNKECRMSKSTTFIILRFLVESPHIRPARNASAQSYRQTDAGTGPHLLSLLQQFAWQAGIRCSVDWNLSIQLSPHNLRCAASTSSLMRESPSRIRQRRSSAL